MTVYRNRGNLLENRWGQAGETGMALWMAETHQRSLGHTHLLRKHTRGRCCS